MASFAVPTDANIELGGKMDELTGKLVAIQQLGDPIQVKTVYGLTDALRVQVVGLDEGTDEGVRLLFWSAMRNQVSGTHAKGVDWAVGEITQSVQANDETRTVYLLELPDDIDPDAIESAIDAFEAKRTLAEQGR